MVSGTREGDYGYERRGHTVTGLLARWQHGDDVALNLLMARIYGELRRLARRCLRKERLDHTLETRDLVHEAFLRLRLQREGGWRNRAHFLAVAAAMMRRTLVDHARRRLSVKRGGHLGALAESAGSTDGGPAVDVLALHDALSKLEKVDPMLATVVELRFFAGLDHDELGAILGISNATARRHWRVARAWLYCTLRLRAGGSPRAPADGVGQEP